MISIIHRRCGKHSGTESTILGIIPDLIQLLLDFSTPGPWQDNTAIQFFPKILSFHWKVFSTTNYITNDPMIFLIFCNIPYSYATRNQILAKLIPSATAQHLMDVL